MVERETALDVLMRIPVARPLSAGAGRGYDTRDFVAECRELNFTPHVARKEGLVGDRRPDHPPCGIQIEPEGP